MRKSLAILILSAVVVLLLGIAVFLGYEAHRLRAILDEQRNLSAEETARSLKFSTILLNQARKDLDNRKVDDAKDALWLAYSKVVQGDANFYYYKKGKPFNTDSTVNSCYPALFNIAEIQLLDLLRRMDNRNQVKDGDIQHLAALAADFQALVDAFPPEFLAAGNDREISARFERFQNNARTKEFRDCAVPTIPEPDAVAPSMPAPDNLDRINCQMEDLPPPGNGEVWGRVIQTPFPKDYFGEQKHITNMHFVSFTDYALTYQGVECQIFQFVDSDAAHRAFVNACDPITTATTTPDLANLGDEACDTRKENRRVTFRRSKFVVVTSSDLMNLGTTFDLAINVDQRIRQFYK